jgi:hypothetical protein
MRKLIINCIASAILLTNCTSKSDLTIGRTENGLTVFSGTLPAIKLKSNQISLGNFILPTRIKLIDDYLFITDLKRSEGMVAIYDLENRRFIKSIIPNGSGPYELSAVSSIIPGNSGKVYFYDVQSLRLLESDLSQLVNDSTFQPNFVKRILFDNYEKPLRIVNISDTSFLTFSVPGIKGRFSTMDSKFDLTGFQFGEYPPIQKKGELYEMTEISYFSKVLANLYACSIATHQSGNLVVAHNNVDVIEFYNYTNSSRVLRIVGPDQNFPPEYSMSSSQQAFPCKECRCGYSSPQATAEYIAVLRLEKLYSNPDAYISNLIYLFDWSGNLIKILELDAQISEFVIDEKRQKIFAVAFDQDEPLLEYNLSIE